jgi:phospholipid transport system substrate-binding protein
MKRRDATRLLLGLAAAALAGPPAGPAEAATPTEQVRTAIDRVLQLVQDPALRAPARAEERRRQIRTVANEIFDWQETGKRALARHWQARTPQQREEFSALFADLVERSYVSKIEGYTGEKIVYGSETVEGEQATVRTRLVTRNNTEIPIDYRLSRTGDRWRVYDVLIEGVSLVASYRNQFNRVIQQSGYDELIRKMKSKQEELQFEDTEGGKKRS